MKLEIKTSEEIEWWLFKDGHKLKGTNRLKKKEQKKWIAVDNLVSFLNHKEKLVEKRTLQTKRQKRILIYFIENFIKNILKTSHNKH